MLVVSLTLNVIVIVLLKSNFGGTTLHLSTITSYIFSLILCLYIIMIDYVVNFLTPQNFWYFMFHKCIYSHLGKILNHCIFK